MRTKIFSRLIVMVLCVVILAGSIGLYAAATEDQEKACKKYCSKHYGEPHQKKLYEACYDGCIYGVDL